MGLHRASAGEFHSEVVSFHRGTKKEIVEALREGSCPKTFSRHTKSRLS